MGPSKSQECGINRDKRSEEAENTSRRNDGIICKGAFEKNDSSEQSPDH